MNAILLALLSHPHMRDVRIFLQLQYFVDEWWHGRLRPNWVPRLHGVPELVELVGWDEAGVAASLPHARNGRRLSEVLADHIDEGHPIRNLKLLSAGPSHVASAIQRGSKYGHATGPVWNRGSLDCRRALGQCTVGIKYCVKILIVLINWLDPQSFGFFHTVPGIDGVPVD
jgi:hypothetical protein